MSFPASRALLEPSFQLSKKISGKGADPKAPMRLLFPGGWDNKVSDVFKWYEAQPYKFFRKLEYYKEQEGVGHEFVVIPLQEGGGAPTDWFCRLERMADPAQQLAAIATEGTEAYDYIQSFDSDLLGPKRGAGLVAEITFPRDFDLYDVLAICSAISEHQLAHRYTLQQYNCYFFSWAIILSLARRAADWESLPSTHIDSIKAAILSTVSSPPNVEDAKLAYILSTAHGSDNVPMPPLLHNVLASEMHSPRFLQSVNEGLGSTLWVDHANTRMKEAVKSCSAILAEQTLDLLIGGLDVDLDTRLENSLRTEIALGQDLDAEELQMEGILLYHMTCNDFARNQMRRQFMREIDRHKKNYIPPNPTHSPQRRLTILPAVKASITFLRVTCLLLPAGIRDASHLATIYNQVAIGKKQSKGVRMLKYVGNTFRHLPSELSAYSKLIPLLTEETFLGLELVQRGSGFLINMSSLVLDQTIIKLLQKLPEQDGNTIRAVAFHLMVSIAKIDDDFDHLSPKQIWDYLLWNFLGDIITSAILKAVFAEQPNGIEFKCFQPPRIKEPVVEEPEFESTPTIRLQQFIQERIVRLSKHDIDHAPITKHIPVPAMAAPCDSQERMKNSLEQIWRRAYRMKRFRD